MSTVMSFVGNPALTTVRLRRKKCNYLKNQTNVLNRLKKLLIRKISQLLLEVDVHWPVATVMFEGFAI